MDHPFWMLHGERKSDHVADIVRNEIGAIDLELVENGRHIAGLGLFVEAAGGLG